MLSSTTPVVASNAAIEAVSEINSTLFSIAVSQHISHIENLSKVALQSLGKESIIRNCPPSKLPSSRKSTDSSLTGPQRTNFSIRFGLDDLQPTTQRQQWFSGSIFSSSSANDGKLYEDVTAEEVLNAPISDISIVQKSEPVPEGFYRISKTLNCKKANLNYKSGGNELYICIKKDLTRTLTPITALIVIYPDKGETMPPGYSVIRRGAHACNVNTGTSSERIFICYKKDGVSNPITDLLVLLPSKMEDVPRDFNLIDVSPSGQAANLNSGTSGSKVYLCYKQSMTQFMCLDNDSPLHLAVSPTSPRKRFFSEDGKAFGASKSTLSDLRASQAASKAGATTDKRVSPRATTLSPFPSVPATASPSPSVSATASPSVPAVPPIPPVPVVPALASADVASVTSPDDVLLSFSQDPSAAAAADVGTDILSLSPRSECDEESGKGEAQSPGRDTPMNFDDDEETASVHSEDEPLVIERRGIVVVDAAGTVVPRQLRQALLPILAAACIRHGNVCKEAVHGLVLLLNTTNFFDCDFAVIPSSGSVTMLDLTVEVICDRLDLCQEGEMPSLLLFLQTLIKKSKGVLSHSIIRRIFKTISFFMIYHAAMSNWLANGHESPRLSDGSRWREAILLEDLMLATLKHVETFEKPVCLPDASRPPYDYSSLPTESTRVCRQVIDEFIDGIIDSVEVCRVSDTVQSAISNKSTFVSSRSFWQFTGKYARLLFVCPSYRNVFGVMCAVCKLAWPTITVTEQTGVVSSRDLGTKLLALDLLLALCNNCGENMKSSKVIGYLIRRLVVPCILNNIPLALHEPRVFAMILKLISSLWSCWRQHLRIEFANLCEQLCIRVLQASVIKVKPVFQMIVLQEISVWFAQPQLLLEMFVNFDMDGKFVSHWNIFSHLVRAVCVIAKRSDKVVGFGGMPVSTSEWKSAQPQQAGNVQDGFNSITVRDVNLQALQEVARIAKALMDATGHAYLMMQDSNFRTRSLQSSAGWEQEEDDDSESVKSATDATTTTATSTTASAGDEGAEVAVRPRTDTVVTQGETGRRGLSKRYSNVHHSRVVHQEAEELLTKAISIYENKGLRKALQFLISKHFMADTPQEIASFLRVYKNSFDPSAIGDYLGEGGVSPQEQEYWAQIRYRYTRAVSFVDLDLEQALRLFLTGCGFRLPGEAQKIDRFVDVFQKVYWADNHGTSNCPLKHADTVFLLAFAMIMLNTDLNKEKGKKVKHKKMTKDEFISNLRGGDGGDNIDHAYLSKIYDNIAAQPIEMAVSASESKDGGGKALTSVTGGVGVTLAGSAAAAPTAPAAGSAAASGSLAVALEFSPAGEKVLMKEISRNIRDSEDLLRSLSLYTYGFQLTGVDTKLSLELVSFMYETVWFHFKDICEALLGEHKSEPSITIQALDILCYSLTSAIFLGIKVERHAFSSLLLTFHKTCVADSIAAKQAGHPLQDYSWYQIVESCKPERAMETIAEVHKLVVLLKDALQEIFNHELTRTVAARIEKKAKVLEKNQYFVCEGELGKRNRSGRLDQYRFFLFSDYLIYCHQGMMKGEYLVNQQLSLLDMTVDDYPDDPTNCTFYVNHTVKSFTVVAESPSAKFSWLRDLRQTISSCNKRNEALSRAATRKLSIVERIESQKKVLSGDSEVVPRAIRFSDTASDDAEPPLVTKSVSFSPFSNNQHTDSNSDVDSDAEGDDLPADVNMSAIRMLEVDDEEEEEEEEEASNVSGTRSRKSTMESTEGQECMEQSPVRKPPGAAAVPFTPLADARGSAADSPSTPHSSVSSTPSVASPQNCLPDDSESKEAALDSAEFSRRISDLPERNFLDLFFAGSTFWNSLLDLNRDSISAEVRIKLLALQKQAKCGSFDGGAVAVEAEVEASCSCKKSDSQEESALVNEAWSEIGDMTADAAKREFLECLFSVAPYWPYQQFLA